MRVIHEWGRFLSIEENGVERLRYQYQMEGDPLPSAPKPFIHPIRTPAGLEMTAESPHDHTWHRGVWFTWKYVNGVNYWEENQEIVGRQITLDPPAIDSIPGDANAVRWYSDLHWRDMRGGIEKTRLMEQRWITCRLIPDGAMVLDWEIVQTPHPDEGDVTLDRTVFTTWGGYSGVVVRMAQALHKQSIVFDDGTQTERPTGQPHLWGGIQGQLDTGRDNHASFLFMPSQRNRRYPEPMYGNVRPFSNFFGPAPLFHEPLVIKAGETLRHACRVVALPRRIDAQEADGYYRDWLRREGETPAAASAEAATP